MSKYSIEEVADIVENEGLGYAVTDYINYKVIKDEKLAGLWLKAETALYEIQKVLDHAYNEEEKE